MNFRVTNRCNPCLLGFTQEDGKHQLRPKLKLSSSWFYAKSLADPRIAFFNAAHHAKVDYEQTSAIYIQAIGSGIERLHESTDDWLHSTHDDRPHHCSPDVSSRFEQCHGGLRQKVADRPQRGEARTLNCKAELWTVALHTFLLWESRTS